MELKDIKGLSKQELTEKLEVLRKELMEYQFKRKSGIEKPHLYQQVRKNIARILTIMKEKGNEKK